MSNRPYVCAWIAAAGFAHEASPQESEFRWFGGFTVVGLDTDDDRISGDETLSADLFMELQQGNGQWFFYLEGNSSLDSQAVSAALVESNADAATAIDPDGGGRIQLSEINYRFSLDSGAGLTVGLVDPSAYLDRTRITNDENVQFLGASFVNNPTIEFPDYTIGLVYERPRSSSWPQINTVITRANGLADHPSLSYSQLFDDQDEGVFAAVGFGWPSERHLIRAGSWINTKPHAGLSGESQGKDNYGAYLVYGYSRDPHGLNLRLGVANDAVSRAGQFLALAYRYRWRQHALGVGVAHTLLSGDVVEPNLDDSTHLEVFGRFTIGGRIHLTASFQRLLHSSFVAGEGDPRDTAVVGGLRFHYEF